MNRRRATILAAIDASAAAGPVLSTAVALGRALAADVEALHVVDDDGTTAVGTADRFGVPYREQRGDPLACITERARGADVVAIVVGARRRMTGGHLGHLARAVADTLDKPVVVVPPESAPRDELRTVVVAMEGSPGKARGVKTAIEVAAGSGLELVVVHVDDEDSIPSFSDQVAHETEAYTDEFLARYAPGAPKARLELRVGVPAEEVLKASDAAGADLVAVGWPHVVDPERGTVAQEVLDRSHVPVLLVALADDAG